MKKKISKFYSSFIDFVKYNRQFCSYVVLSFLCTLYIRIYTTGSIWISASVIDLASILIIGSFGFFYKPQKQFNYYFVMLLLIDVVCIVNAVYYDFYSSFASFSLLTALGQVGEVGDAVFAKMNVLHFIYLLAPVSFFAVNKHLTNRDYFNFVAKFENSKSLLKRVFIYGLFFLCLGATMLSATAFSRLAKQWNREYIVNKFGIIVYQINDLVSTLRPKITSMFGYDVALKDFTDYYAENTIKKSNNEYTDIFKGKNVIFVHMESMTDFLMNTNINGVEITPNINRLASEGMYFRNFYPQISVGTSSDTEFTLTSSLMPATNGTVFVSYYDRDYVTIPKLFSEQGYYTFSMHGNKASMWNRRVMHPSLGYRDFYSSTSYDIDETIGLGLSDKSFFRQSINILENIEENNNNYMGTVITLSNHTPFANNDKFEHIDLTKSTKVYNEITGKYEIVKRDYLENTILGNYIRSGHYADEAMGEFISYIKNSDKFDNTIFVFYGDHDPKISLKDFNYYYNYDAATDRVLTAEDEGYIPYDYYDNELNKKTPLIIWSKNKKFEKQIDYYMGMIDVMPTIGNMFGIYNKYALGNDIFEIKDDNVIAFPNGNFLTNKVYYYNSKEEYKAINLNEVLSDEYIANAKNKADKLIDISNDIIVYDLIGVTSDERDKK